METGPYFVTRATDYVREHGTRSGRQIHAELTRHTMGFGSHLGDMSMTEHECMEAWLLSAWSPVGARDAKLEGERARLGFDPTREPQRLSHKHKVPKSAKQVCRDLAADDETLERAELDDLRERGRSSGLAAFITEAEALVRLLQTG